MYAPHEAHVYFSVSLLVWVGTKLTVWCQANELVFLCFSNQLTSHWLSTNEAFLGNVKPVS
jgi:hypothetical protein